MPGHSSRIRGDWQVHTHEIVFEFPVCVCVWGFKFGDLGRRGQMLGKKNAVGIPLGQVVCGGAMLPRNPGGINELKTKDIILRSSGPRLGLDTLRDEH